jgi:hypothetical protein
MKILFGIRNEKYSAKSLETNSNNYFENVKLSLLLRTYFVTSYDIKRWHGHFFMQAETKKKKEFDFFIKDVARSTSAILAYFEYAYLLAKTSITDHLIPVFESYYSDFN